MNVINVIKPWGNKKGHKYQVCNKCTDMSNIYIK